MHSYLGAWNALECFYHGSKHYEPWSDCSWRFLILVHIICNIGYQSTQADERADNNCHEWQDKGYI